MSCVITFDRSCMQFVYEVYGPLSVIYSTDLSNIPMSGRCLPVVYYRATERVCIWDPDGEVNVPLRYVVVNE